MRSLRFLPFVLLAGCGGSSPVATAPNAATRSRVDTLLERSARATSFAFGSGAGFSRSRSSRPRLLIPRAASRAEGDTYFSELHGLWIREEDDRGDKLTFWEDEATTLPAGHWTPEQGSIDDDPMVETTTFALTKGRFAGASGTSRRETFRDNRGTQSIRESYGDGTRLVSDARWWYEDNDSTMFYTETARADEPGGAWWTYDYDQPGSADRTYRFVDSTNYRWRLTYRGDFSGEGAIEGTSPGLPARLAWGEDQEGTITWADGTSEPFANWSLFE